MKCFSKPWKPLLLAVPLLVCSLTGQASEIEFATPYATSPTEGQLINANGATMWTYTTNGTVSNFTYSNNSGLSFSIPVGKVAENSLTLTSSQRFSGKLNGISILCSEIPGLAITAYVGQTELGDLIWTGKGYANSSSFSRGLLYERISCTVHLSLQEKVFPLYIGSSVTFDSSLSGVDLSNHTYEGKGILFTLDSSKGDGCVDEDGNGVIYIGSTLSDIAVSNLDEKVRNHVTNHWPGDPGYAEDFAGGITVMAARGKGIIGLEAMTESNYAYHVKIGDAAPVEVASTTRRWLEVPYNVNRDTYIYIYLVDKSAAARANNDSGRSGTRIGKRETAHGIVFSLRCASAPVEVSDISVYVDYIMGRDTFIFHNADVNNDDRINVADIVKILKSK